MKCCVYAISKQAERVSKDAVFHSFTSIISRLLLPSSNQVANAHPPCFLVKEMIQIPPFSPLLLSHLSSIFSPLPSLSTPSSPSSTPFCNPLKHPAVAKKLTFGILISGKFGNCKNNYNCDYLMPTMEEKGQGEAFWSL